MSSDLSEREITEAVGPLLGSWVKQLSDAQRMARLISYGQVEATHAGIVSAKIEAVLRDIQMFAESRSDSE
jgi:hypothetical protein